MLKKKIYIVSLFSLIFGTTLAGCANYNTYNSDVPQTETMVTETTEKATETEPVTETTKSKEQEEAERRVEELRKKAEQEHKEQEEIETSVNNEADKTAVLDTEENIDILNAETFVEESEEVKEIIDDIIQEEALQNAYAENYSDIGYNEYYSRNGTKVWWTAIKGEPQLVLANDYVNGKERPSSVAARTGAAYVINGGEWWSGSGMACGVTGIGDTIYQALYDGENGDTLILRQDGQLDSVYMTEDVYKQINPKWAVKGFVPIINKGKRTEYNHARQPRTFIGQDWDGTYYIGVSGGRGNNGAGLTYDELYEFAVGQMSSDLRFLYTLDGGGSSTLVCNGRVVNSPTDGSERAVANCIIFY